MRTKKIALNLISDILPYIFIGIVGLFKVNVLIHYVGDVGNGYYQLINQIITYVFLAQAGFGEAVIYKLYKPFAEKNKHDINRIYSGSRKIFKIIGFIILGLIILVSLFLYLFYGFEDGYKNSALLCFVIISSSYLIAYFGRGQTYMSVLSAAQEKYVYSIVTNIIKLICDISIIFVAIKFGTLESIAILILIVKIFEEIVLRIVVSKKYRWLKEIADKDTSMTKMVKDLAWLQIGYVVLNNVDAVLLGVFVGPVMVSIYTSYNFILRYLNEISSRVEMSAVYSFGNVFAKKEDNRIKSLYNEFFVLFVIIAFSLSITFMFGIRSFVNIWIGKENYILSYFTIILFTLTLFSNIIYYPLLALINADGLFKDNKKHIFICASINVILSIILVVPFKINGILIATVIAFVVNIFLKTKLVSNKILKIKHFDLLKKYILVLCIFIVVAIIGTKIEFYLYSLSLNLFTCILLLGFIFALVLTITTLIMYFVNDNTKELLKRLNLLLKRKIG